MNCNLLSLEEYDDLAIVVWRKFPITVRCILRKEKSTLMIRERMTTVSDLFVAVGIKY